MYVYVASIETPTVYFVGFYAPFGEWCLESVWDEKEEAANRTAWLNGSGKSISPA